MERKRVHVPASYSAAFMPPALRSGNQVKALQVFLQRPALTAGDGLNFIRFVGKADAVPQHLAVGAEQLELDFMDFRWRWRFLFLAAKEKTPGGRTDIVFADAAFPLHVIL